MITIIHDPKDNPQKCSKNTGSCVKMVNYLSKENVVDKPFFSHYEDNVSASDVIRRIDNNKRTLKRNEDKFYMLSYDPSADEIKYIVRKFIGKDIEEFTELSYDEKQLVFNIFRDYSRDCMNVYAKSFYRDKELTANDLVYFGKVEEFRYYTYEDEEVKNGTRKRGDIKPGLNLHVHVVVSRMDASQTMRLSPLTSKGNINKLNGQLVKNGFSIKQWHNDCLEVFSNKYGYVYPKRQYEREKHINLRIRNYIQNQATIQLMDGMEEEQKMLSNIRKIKRLAHSPKSIIKGYVRQKINNILFEREQGL